MSTVVKQHPRHLLACAYVRHDKKVQGEWPAWAREGYLGGKVNGLAWAREGRLGGKVNGPKEREGPPSTI